MASTMTATLAGQDRSVVFTSSATDDQFNALKDVTDSMNVYEVMLGQKINAVSGTFVTGSALFRLRNTRTGQTKLLFCGNENAGAFLQEYITRPITIEYGDVLEAYITAAGS